MDDPSTELRGILFLVKSHLSSALSVHYKNHDSPSANKTYLYKKPRLLDPQPPPDILRQQCHPPVPRHLQPPIPAIPHLRDTEFDPAPQIREALPSVLLGAVDLLELAVV